MLLVRTARESDAGGLLELLSRLDEETRSMMYEPGERSTSVEEQRKALGAVLADGRGTVLVAEECGRVVGFLEATVGAFRRDRHVAHLVLGVLRERAGRGIGTALMTEAGRWPESTGSIAWS